GPHTARARPGAAQDRATDLLGAGAAHGTLCAAAAPAPARRRPPHSRSRLRTSLVRTHDAAASGRPDPPSAGRPQRDLSSSGHRQSFPEGPIRIGSDAHKTLFCRTLLDSFDPYKPAVIDWPELDAQARDRLVSLPIWDIAVQTEGRARLNVASYAAVTSDPLLRQ